MGEQEIALGGDGLLHDRVDGGKVHGRVGVLVRAIPGIAAVAVDCAQRRNHIINVVSDGNAAAACLHQVSVRRLSAQEGKEKGFFVLPEALNVRFDHIFQMVCGKGGIFAIDADDGIDVIGQQRGVEGFVIVFRRRPPGHINGILRGADPGNHGSEGLLEVLGIVVEGHGVFLAGVRRHHACTAAVGDNHGALASGQGIAGDEFAPVEGLFRAFRAQGPALAGDGIEEAVGPGERTGMGSRRHGPPLGAPGLDDDDGLYAGGVLQRRDEFLAVADALDIQENRVRVVMTLQIGEEIRFVDIRFVAHGYHGGKADVFHRGLSHQRQPQRAALGNHRQIAAGDVAGDEGRIEIRGGGIDPEDVRTEDAHAMPGRVVRNFPLFFEIADLRKTRRDDNGISCLLPAQLLDGVKDEAGRDRHDGDVDLAFHLLQRAPDGNSFDLAAGGIDRIDGTAITARENIF